MKGYNLFIEKFDRLNEIEQDRLLSRIFGVSVILFDISDYENKIIIKLYDMKNFYQFVFHFGNSDICLDIKTMDRIVLCNIFVNKFTLRDGMIVREGLCNFINILKDEDISYFDIL